MSAHFSIKVYKQYFNFSAAHFLVFANGTREPLHGHNYRVMVRGEAQTLTGDMVFDFLDIKPVVKKVCDRLDHLVLLPKENPFLDIKDEGNNYHLLAHDGDQFSLPKKDVLILPLSNTSVERLAVYLAQEIEKEVMNQFNFRFRALEIEVEETPGQSAVFVLNEESRI